MTCEFGVVGLSKCNKPGQPAPDNQLPVSAATLPPTNSATREPVAPGETPTTPTNLPVSAMVQIRLVCGPNSIAIETCPDKLVGDLRDLVYETFLVHPDLVYFCHMGVKLSLSDRFDSLTGGVFHALEIHVYCASSAATHGSVEQTYLGTNVIEVVFKHKAELREHHCDRNATVWSLIEFVCDNFAYEKGAFYLTLRGEWLDGNLALTTYLKDQDKTVIEIEVVPTFRICRDMKPGIYFRSPGPRYARAIIVPDGQWMITNVYPNVQVRFINGTRSFDWSMSTLPNGTLHDNTTGENGPCLQFGSR